MYIKNLKLKNYRNYNELDINFNKNLNVIYGDNAQGKTNILESMFICACARSHRTSKDSELVKFNEKSFEIKLYFEKSNIDYSIEISYGKEQGKLININEIPVKKIGNLMGNLNAVLFSPEDLQIVKEGPSDRRRFMDMTISQLKPSYFYDLQQYSKILAQRNNLLKEIQYNKSLLDTLEIWNLNLVKTGARIIKARKEFIKRLSQKAENCHFKLTEGKEKLNLRYNSSIEIKDNYDIDLIEKNFLKTLDTLSHKEIQKNTTLCGPQRDDYELLLNELNVKMYGSQGQQRSSILSLKMGEIEIIKEETDEYPVLLLDDVLSELDKQRQIFLFKNLKGVQTFVTCTDKNFFDEELLYDITFLNVSKGNVFIK